MQNADSFFRQNKYTHTHEERWDLQKQFFPNSNSLSLLTFLFLLSFFFICLNYIGLI